MASSFEGKVNFVVENYGDSTLAKRFGVTRYPAIFVDDVLVAKPKDFGFYGKGEGSGDGRYTPWKSASSHERFQADLRRMIELTLAGRRDEARARGAAADVVAAQVPRLPEFALTDLAGRPLTQADLVGRVVAVEFWATWCPPCRGTLSWMGELQRRFGNRLAVLALAIESDEGDVRKMLAELGLPLRAALAPPEVARAFGDVTSVPTLLVFDKDGRAAASYYGAPPGLHEEAEAKLAELLK